MDASEAANGKDRLRQERILHNWRQRDVADEVGTTVLTVNRWERGIQQPGSYFRQKLCALFGKSAEELGLLPEEQAPFAAAEEKVEELNQAERIWSVPYPRNPFFTGREEILQKLHEMLKRESALALTSQSWAISGLGGIGKTQIALEYAYRYRQNYRCVFWLNAATQEVLLADIVALAEQLRLPEKHEHDPHRVLLAVKKWFTLHKEWLLILDNADDVAMVSEVVPTDCQGHLLFTSRAQALGSLARRLDVEDMGMVEGTLFLLRRSKLLAPDAFLDQIAEEQLAIAETIVMEMAFFPLALDQAGAYIEEIGCSLATYLDLYRAHHRELLQRRSYVPTMYPESVATTWSLNFQRIEQVNSVATEMLRLCAFLDPDTIPETLFVEGSAALGQLLEPLARDALQLNEAIEELRRFSLVQRNAATGTLRLHRLVQTVLRDTLTRDVQVQLAERVVRAIREVFPEEIQNAQTWPVCQRYLPQAQVCSALVQQYDLAFEEAATLLFRTARYLRAHALYEQAEQLYQQVLHIWEQIHGSDHPEIARTLNNLALLLAEQGKYEQAEPLFQRSLSIWEQVLGPEHPDVARILNNLALLFSEQKKYEQADLLYQRALSIREQAVGPEHPDISLLLNNQAELAIKQRKYEQAERLYQRALHIWEQAKGLEHPGMVHLLHGLANTYREQGQAEQAEALYQRALDIYEQTFGQQHPHTADILYDLALFRETQKRTQNAVTFYQRALAIREQVLGEDHPKTEETRIAVVALLQRIAQDER